jgi:hypothetical protein
MASTSSLKQIAKMTLRVAALAQLALLSAAACSSDGTNRDFRSGAACSTAAQCKANENCLNAVCTPIPTGSAGSVGSAGNSPIGTAGTGPVGGGTAGSAGTPGIPGAGGSSNTAGAPPISSGGSSATAGSGPTGTAGSGPVGNGDPGYWVSKDWHGCSWTGVGTDGTSTITPKDFTTKASGAPYCVSGTVGAEPM